MVTAALTLALGAYFLTIMHRLEHYEPKFNRTDYSHVVVAGAWRLPALGGVERHVAAA